MTTFVEFHVRYRRKGSKTAFHVERDRKWENVDVRYIYFGRNTTRVMSSTIFEIGSRLDSSFEICLETFCRQP